MTLYFPSVRQLSCIALLAAVPAFAAPPVVAEGNGIAVTTFDLEAEAQRVPAESRKMLLVKPENIGQIASNLYVRRALAAQAERDGLAADPVVAANLQIARDRVLSDARLARLDAANMPADNVLNDLAEASYRTDSKRFQVPEQIRARHILIATATDEARAKAEKLLADIKGGADFEALAREHSADPGSAPSGGDLGFFGSGRMVKPFEDAVSALKQSGDISGIVETQFGFHIIKLEERRPAMTRPFDEVREELRREALVRVLSNARATEARRLGTAARFDDEAIKAFAEKQR